MRKAMFVAIVLALSVGTVAAFASSGSVTKEGKNYNGTANPGSCVIMAENNDAHVNCSHSDKAARVRYRFTPAHGADFTRGPATVSADLHIIKGACTVRWMAPVAHAKARTARVTVSPHGYCHIRSVTGSQP